MQGYKIYKTYKTKTPFIHKYTIWPEVCGCLATSPIHRPFLNFCPKVKGAYDCLILQYYDFSLLDLSGPAQTCSIITTALGKKASSIKTMFSKVGVEKFAWPAQSPSKHLRDKSKHQVHTRPSCPTKHCPIPAMLLWLNEKIPRVTFQNPVSSCSSKGNFILVPSLH